MCVYGDEDARSDSSSEWVTSNSIAVDSGSNSGRNIDSNSGYGCSNSDV